MLVDEACQGEIKTFRKQLSENRSPKGDCEWPGHGVTSSLQPGSVQGLVCAGPLSQEILRGGDSGKQNHTAPGVAREITNRVRESVFDSTKSKCWEGTEETGTRDVTFKGGRSQRGSGLRTSSQEGGTLSCPSPLWEKLDIENKTSETWRRDVGPDFAGGRGIWSSFPGQRTT